MDPGRAAPAYGEHAVFNQGSSTAARGEFMVRELSRIATASCGCGGYSVRRVVLVMPVLALVRVVVLALVVVRVVEGGLRVARRNGIAHERH